MAGKGFIKLILIFLGVSLLAFLLLYIIVPTFSNFNKTDEKGSFAIYMRDCIDDMGIDYEISSNMKSLIVNKRDVFRITNRCG